VGEGVGAPFTVTDTVFMFSGQGSQYFQMGKELYGSNPTFRDWMVRLDDVARGLVGESVIATVYSGANAKSDRFDRTLLTHPAIFMVEYSLAQALMQAGVRPDLVLGASMGSFAAAAVAGLLDVEDALRAVVRQAKSLEEHGEPGGMMAVLTDPALFEEDFLRLHSELAAVNFDSHFIVSAKRTELAQIEATLKQRQIVHQRLPVSSPFHSQWIDRAKTTFGAFMQSIRWKQGQVPMICSDRTTAVSELPADYFWDVVRNPIRFREAAIRLDQERPRRFIDVGPAGTLATFLKYTLPKTTRSTVRPILTPFGLDQRNLADVSSSHGH
jgi:bacillaene synthase trans-acting acyltransferase